MECAQNESPLMLVEMDGRGSTHVHDSIRSHGVSDRVQVLSGHDIIVAHQGRYVTTETNEEE